MFCKWRVEQPSAFVQRLVGSCSAARTVNVAEGSTVKMKVKLRTNICALFFKMEQRGGTITPDLDLSSSSDLLRLYIPQFLLPPS